MHGLIFETSICYWQDQPGNFFLSLLKKKKPAKVSPLQEGKTNSQTARGRNESPSLGSGVFESHKSHDPRRNHFFFGSLVLFLSICIRQGGEKQNQLEFRQPLGKTIPSEQKVSNKVQRIVSLYICTLFCESVNICMFTQSVYSYRLFPSWYPTQSVLETNSNRQPTDKRARRD
jgi:hypothetical protein